LSDEINMAEWRRRMAANVRVAESERLPLLMQAARVGEAEAQAVRTRAAGLLGELREGAKGGWIDRFMQEYDLGSAEGVALLALAEAYLRVPDAITADELIQDKIGQGDWHAHRGASESFLVNRATFGLVMTQALVREDENTGVLRKLLRRIGEPAVRVGVSAAMRFMGEQFVLGRNIEEALDRARGAGNKGFRHSYDMLGEAAWTFADAERYFSEYALAIKALGARPQPGLDLFARDNVSVKLSALYPRYDEFQIDRCVPALTGIIIDLARLAREAGIGLTIDAEETERLEMSLDIIEAVAREPSLRGWDGLGMAVQAYQRRARDVIGWVDAMARDAGRRMIVRLVKGAYWDTEIKRAQERGHADYPVWTRKPSTDVSYLACARAMLAAPNLYPAFATHNAMTVSAVLQWAGDRQDFEFQRLHGMGVGLYEKLIAERGLGVRIYAPVGGHRDLLAYLVRRLLENGANTSFVHQIADASLTEADLLVDPVHLLDVISKESQFHNPGIPMPMNLFGTERSNSAGIDFADRDGMRVLMAELAQLSTTQAAAGPIVNGVTATGAAQAVVSPMDAGARVGSVVAANAEHLSQALSTAHAAQIAWSACPVEERAACLERMAELLKRDRNALLDLLMREAGKTLADALAEVREAEDFCRYYAVQARQLWQPTVLPGPTGERNELQLAGRGVFACISPWNFPLAIFLGQITAALVAGNSVIAKPAPQTPLIAARAIGLLLEAGVPAQVIHLLPGDGVIGRDLVADRRVAGVAFTGSTGTARNIARTLLEDERRPLVPLIAETGGLNAMIVDSTALPEQVVRDIIASGFQSAGQRCSALRLLCLQEEIAERVLTMLKGAMDALVIGNPCQLETDVGPVIDAAAAQRITAHIAAHAERVVAQMKLPDGCDKGHFVAPTVIRLDSIESLGQEIFGPVVHVVTWKAGELEATVQRINAAGFGLTMGLHSRIEGSMEKVRAAARVGNLYVNRSMIGAVVGSQPFGGEGLSGTGFKAGGPHYLLRFATERALCVDTTSAGGNASLFSQDR